MLAYQEQQLDALGDPTRRGILARLLNGPLPVGKLAEGFPVSRPAISQHLRILKEARLVTDAAAGTRRLYAIDPTGFDSLREYFEQFWTIALNEFKKKVEADNS
jgi:DNA-binding transcriptional ArsR family regulator